MAERVDLAYPVYLDVPMMTSFVAAIEDGIAYGSDVTQRQDQQKAISGQGEARAGIFGLAIVSSLLSLDLRGKISSDKAAAESEEVKLVKKHTEASLFMRLRHVLKTDERIVETKELNDTEELRNTDRDFLVEITGQIFRSPASETLEAMFSVLDILGIDTSGGTTYRAQSTQGGKGKRGKGQKNVAPETDEFALDRDALLGLQLMKRIKDDLTESKVIDVVMRSPATDGLIVAATILLRGEY